MGTRPLRQHYERDGHAPVSVVTDPSFSLALAPWRRHRDRFDAALRALTESDWDRPTRCDAWSVREVIGHLVVVDQFWALTFGNIAADAPPTTFLEGFNPSNSTDDLVAATLSLSIADLLDRFRGGADAVFAVLETFDADAWNARTESPLGHLPSTCIVGHMLWDSWLHERDIFEPIGTAPTSPADELLAVTMFSFCFAGLQGGLLGDTQPVGPGPDTAIGVTVQFDDLPDHSLQIQIDDTISVTARAAGTGAAAGSAVALADAFGGRTALGPQLEQLPDDLAAQLSRAALVL